MTETLAHPPSDYVAGRFLPIEGDAIVSTNPAQPQQIIWQGTPTLNHVDAAVDAARQALPQWSGISIDERVAALRRWQQVVRDNADRLAELITHEMGKTLAESRFEAQAVAAKVDVTLDEISSATRSD